MTGILVGVDAGTTSTKAVALDTTGRVRTAHRIPVQWRAVSSGAEIDAESFVAAALAAATGAAEAVPGAKVLGVGVTSIGETGVLLDARGTPIGPSIAWYDTRAAEYAADLRARLGDERFARLTGLPTSGHWSAYMYRWLRDHERDAARGVRWLSVAEWIVHRLGGEQVNELSLASRTGFFEPRSGAFCDEVLTWANAPERLMGALVPAGTAAGAVDAAYGSLAGATLTVAGHDHLCACVGAGVLEDDEIFDSCGTAEAVIAPFEIDLPADRVEAFVRSGITVGRHVLPGRRAALAAAFTGLALTRLLRLAGDYPPVDHELDQQALTVIGASARARASMDHDGTAHLYDIRADLTPGDIFSIAAEAAACVTAELVAGVGYRPDAARVVAAGGWSHLETIRAAKRDRIPGIDFSLIDEAGARGAAIFAGVAAGVFSDLRVTDCRP